MVQTRGRNLCVCAHAETLLKDVCVCVFGCLFVCLCVCVFGCLGVGLKVGVCVCACLCVCVSLCVCVCVSVACVYVQCAYVSTFPAVNTYFRAHTCMLSIIREMAHLASLGEIFSRKPNSKLQNLSNPLMPQIKMLGMLGSQITAYHMEPYIKRCLYNAENSDLAPRT